MAVKTKPDTELPTMTFGEHLEDLRRRLIIALLGFAAAMLVGLYYGRTVTAWLYAPLLAVLRAANLPIQTFTRASFPGFTLYLKVSVFVGFVLAGPWIMLQAWKFISAGLYVSERRAATSLIAISTVMTSLGLAFYYFLMLPAVLAFLIFWTTSYPLPPPSDGGVMQKIVAWFVHVNEQVFFTAPAHPPASTHPAAPATGPGSLRVVEEEPANPAEGEMWFNRRQNEMHLFAGGSIHVVMLTPVASMVPLIDPNDYLNEMLFMGLVVIGIFQIPVVMAFLGMVGIGNPDWLAKRRKGVIFFLAVAAVFITPSQDLFSNVVIPFVAWLLFELGLVFMRLFNRRRERQLKEEG